MYYIILSILIVSCCVVYVGSRCATTVTAFPPDPRTHCCGLSSLSYTRIARGSTALVDEYPWLVITEKDYNGEVYTLCGGALISGKYVLTAAHCVVKYEPENVRLGEYDTSNEGPDCLEIEPGIKECTDGAIRIPIEKTIPHPEYDATEIIRYHDIALIRMAQMAPYTDFIRPICLPTFDITKQTDPIALLKSGWGMIDGKTENYLIGGLLLPYVPRDKCEEIYSNSKKNITLSNGQICAGGNKSKDFCRRDGGLPLLFENSSTTQIVGVVSFGASSCVKHVPVVYTNVYEYTSWIMSTIVA